MKLTSTFIDATQTHFTVACPACPQKFILSGLSVQFQEEMACAQCNTLFRLELDGKNARVRQVRPATGGRPGPAEGSERR